MGSFLVASLLASCGGGGGGGGVVQISASPPLTGRVFSDGSAAGFDIEIAAQSGDLSRAAVQSDGSFRAESLSGVGPWLMRARAPSAAVGFHYAYLSASTGADALTQNLHLFSDLALRLTFASRAESLDAVFNALAAGRARTLPSVDAVRDGERAIARLIQPGLEVGNITADALWQPDATRIDELAAFLEQYAVVPGSGGSGDVTPDVSEVSLYATRPDDALQTTIGEGIPLNLNQLADDRVAPEMPMNARAFGSASNEVTLVWEPATDDIAVTLYRVERDGAVIANTPWPSWQDDNVASGIDHAYRVRAVDASGNVSAPTAAIVVRTLSEPDMVAPSLPTGLGVDASGSALQLSWSADDLGDVAYWYVLRADDGAMSERRARLTATTYVDGRVVAGTRYCYRVLAIDASGRESMQSDEVCGTPDEQILVEDPGGSDGGSGGSTEPAGRAEVLRDVNVSGLACDNALDSVVIDTAVDIDGACFTVNDDLRVERGGRLTIAAGTVLKFAQGKRVTVLTGGSLSALGTESEPVVFSGIEAVSGSWNGISFDHSSSPDNKLEFTVIENGGTGAGGGVALSMWSEDGDVARVAVDGLLIRGSAGDAIQFSRKSVLTSFDNVIVTENVRVGFMAAEVAGMIGEATTFRGNGTDQLSIFPAVIEEATVWPRIDVPWEVAEMAVGAPFVIAPGSELQFGVGRGISVGPAGSLRAVGTAEDPILFTGLSKSIGYWDGITFSFSASPDNRLEHVIIEYGGETTAPGGITTRTDGQASSVVSLSNVQLRFNGGPGLDFSDNTRLLEFNNVVSTGNGFTARVSSDVIADIGRNLSGVGNSEDFIEIADGTVTTSATWPATDVPYFFFRQQIEADVTLAPGVTLIAKEDASFVVSPFGSLSAVGTAAAPVSFRGEVASPGLWRGLRFEESTSSSNRLEHVAIAHGGRGDGEDVGNVVLSCTQARPVALTVESTTLSDSTGWGIYQDGGRCDLTVGPAVSFRGTAAGEVGP